MRIEHYTMKCDCCGGVMTEAEHKRRLSVEFSCRLQSTAPRSPGEPLSPLNSLHKWKDLCDTCLSSLKAFLDSVPEWEPETIQEKLMRQIDNIV